MSTESIHDRYRDLDVWPPERTVAEIVDANRRAVEAVGAAAGDLARAVRGIEGRVRGGGRLAYAGAGTSGRLAVQDAAELAPTFGFDRTVVLLAGGAAAGSRAKEDAEDDVDDAGRSVEDALLGPDDALIGIAASGRTPYTVRAVQRARELGAFTVGIANNPDTPLLGAAAVGILLDTGPEVLAGSTRMAAGTAQKIALNALSTAVLARLGGAYGNLMVGMKAANAKLRVRAAGIVAEATGLGEPEAAEALLRAEGGIREAIVMSRAGVDLGRARALLATHGQRVRDAITEARAGTRAGEAGR